MIYPVPKPKARVSQPRKGLQRGKPMKKTRMKQQRVRMKCRNAKRKGSAFPKRRDPVYADFVRGFPCILAWPLQKGWHDGKRVHWHRCIGKVQFCHIKTRGAGGDDYANAYPGCGAAHEEQHAIGIPKFERRYKLNLRERAQQLAKLYDTTRTFSGLSAPHKGEET